MRRVLLVLLAACPAFAAELVAVANRSGEARLDADAAANLLLGRTSAWPDGHRLTLVISGGAQGEAAVLAMTGRDVPRLMRSWKRLVFSGAAAMPTVTSDDESALALVARTPDAIVLLRTPPPVQAPPGTTLVEVTRLEGP